MSNSYRPRVFSEFVRRQKGFTIVEVLIAIFITGVVALSVYSLYNTFYRHTNTQDMMVEAQQNARVAIDSMERELMNAGYAAGTADIVTEATADSVKFIYTDPATDTTMSSTAGNRLEVKYALQTVSGIQYLTRKADNLSTSSIGNTEQVIPYVDAFAITYYDINGNVIADTSTQPNRNTIKFISVTLTTKTKANVQGTTAPKTFTVETHVRLRNIGVGTTSDDATPPASPTALQVRDPGICGRLKVKWTENAEGDVSGYKVYYGTASGNYTGVINIPLTVLTGTTYSCTRSGGSLSCNIFPVGPSLAYTPSTTAPGSETVYYVAVKAYDNSLNHSGFSTEISGNPTPSNGTYDSGSNDTTLNPMKPVAITGIIGANGASDGQVALSWTAYNTSANPDVTGFRLYRSASPFSTFPIDPATQTAVDWIAGEPGSGKPELTKNSTTYTDVGPGLTGCRTYYYAIAPVNCDATLILDNGGDPNEKKYLVTDYNATCGSGSGSCTPGTGFAAVTGSDTAPAKSTPPGSPTIDARAGWKRVALSLTQPADADLAQTCIYENDSASYPELYTDTGMFPKASGCYQANTTMTPDARLVPDSGGIFTSAELSPAQSTSFWHDSMTVENPGAPSLAETGTYSYRAVSFDLCGNGSNITGAQATTILCGEDPASGEKPPAVTGATFSCCSTPVTLSWTGVSSDTSLPSSINNPYDLAGYRIFRSTTADFASSTMISGSAPFWGTTYNDTTISDGGTYYYRIVTTDCPYERNNPTEATVKSDMLSGYLNSVLLGPVKPGKIDRDEKCVGTSGSCTKDDHREVLTGVDISNTTGTGNNASTPITGYTHHTVTMFLSNSSAGTMTITGASVSWVNSSAYLKEIKIGGGRSGMGITTSSLVLGLTTAVTGNDPYTRAVTNATLTSTQIPAGARFVPVMFKFKDASDNPVDMRDDQLLITLNVRNDSTGTTTCVTYLTVSQSLEAVSVPFGPSITATQQNKPASPTFSYAVPGPTGLNTVPSGSNSSIVAGSNLTVTVSANIEGNTINEVTGTKIAVASAKLYYKVTAKTTTTAPTSGFTEVTMTNTSGNNWSGAIPANDGQRIWYYIVAIDTDGNFDRDPEIADGAYVYDQENFNICDVTPSTPINLTATPSGSDVALSWDAVTTYTNGASVDATDTIQYRIYRGSTQIGTDQAGTTYSDTGLAAGVYNYTVKAINACASPGPNVSSASNTAAGCVGSSGSATLTVTPATIYRGDSYTVSIQDCLAVNGGYSLTTEIVNSTSGFTGFTNTSTAPGSYNPTITESGPATGSFTKTITTTSNASDSTKLLTLSTDTITVTYPYASPSSRTISVVVDPCTSIPKAPTGFSGSVSGQNMTVSWTAVTQNTDNSAISDLAGYRIYEKVCKSGKPNCTGNDIRKDWFLRTTVGSGTTSSVIAADQGNVNTYIYYFKTTAIDSCGTPNESAYSSSWNETN